MADNENIPIDWDYTSPTGRARYFTLPSSDGPVIDGCKLGDRVMIFQANATSVMEFVGGNDVFSIRRLFGHGIIAKKARLEFGGGYQLVVAQRALVVHDGVTARRPADNKVEVRFFSEMTNKERMHCYADEARHEVSICYPSGQILANKRLVYNWMEDTWSFDAFNDTIVTMVSSFAPLRVPTWDSIRGRWFDQSQSWYSLNDVSRRLEDYQLRPRSFDVRGRVFTKNFEAAQELFALDTANEDIWMLDADNEDLFLYDVSSASDYDAHAGRQCLDLDELTSDAAHTKFIRSVYMYVTGYGRINVQFGVRPTPRGPTKWGSIRTIDLTNDTEKIKIDTRLTGRYFDYRFGSWGGALLPGSWRVSGMDLEIEMLGLR